MLMQQCQLRYKGHILMPDSRADQSDRVCVSDRGRDGGVMRGV